MNQFSASFRKLSPSLRQLVTYMAALLALALLLVIYVAVEDGYVIFFVYILGVCASVIALWLMFWVLEKDEGPDELQFVSNAIREGAEGFFATQYTAIGRMSFILAGIITTLYLFRADASVAVPGAPSRFALAITMCVSFLLGAACSGFSGYVGMWVSVRANVRVASSARRSYNEAIQIALRGGAFSGLVVVTVVVVGLTILFGMNRVMHSGLDVTQVPHLMIGFGFGASFVALFAQLGGGIYTKAADVGADLVGKVESNIPEDDPRNPAVIADLVGDNVGDCAGRGADLFESISAEIIGSMILGGKLASTAGIDHPVSFMFFPLVIHGLDLLISSAGVMSVRTASGANPTDLEYGRSDDLEDPMVVLRRGFMVSTALAVGGVTIASRGMLYSEAFPEAWWKFAICGYIGITCSVLFLVITQYYTDYAYGPVKRIAAASTSGHGTNIIIGISVGMESTAMPVLVIGSSLLGAYWLGSSAMPGGGLFGTSVATMGMLSTAVYVLSMDTFGPIADNGGGIAEMGHQPPHVRNITDRLDAVGNVTKAVTKGYSVGSAGLACFLLFSAFQDVISEYSGHEFSSVDFAIPEVFIGGLLGGMLVFLFSGWAIASVGRTAQMVVVEVRRQFQARPGIMDGTEKPDYHACVALVAKASLQEMVKPGLLAVLMPCAVGFVFRLVGSMSDRPLLGPQVLAGFLMIATTAGILTSLFLNNAGGAWDNAKKYVETGPYGGKGSEAHKAAVTGDTVGDPFKDTAGPSLHVLIKLLATISLVLGPLFLSPNAARLVQDME